MVNAIILLKIARGRVNVLAEQLAEFSEISEVYSVAGPYDLVAVVRVAHSDDLAQLVTEKMASLDGITHSETMLAFRAYSRHDLDGLFAVGM